MPPDQHVTHGMDFPASPDPLSPPAPADAVVEDAHRWQVLDVQPQAASVARVRRQVRAVLTRWDAEDLEWVTSQLLTEIVTNAVLHAGTPFDVVLTHAPGNVRVEVRDHNPRRPRTRHFSTAAATGRGMQLVDQLATTWGVIPHPAGKTVWFELAPNRTGPNDPDPHGPAGPGGPGGGPDEEPDGDVDLDALLESLGATPPAALHPPDTDIACSTHPHRPRTTHTADHQRTTTAA